MTRPCARKLRTLRFESLEPRLAMAALFVSPGGSDLADGSLATPWQTMQKAANSVSAGDTVTVRAGTYTGFDLRRDGTAAARITFSADAGVLINARNSRTPDGINLEGADYVTIEGFTVVGVPRAGIRSVINEGVIILNNRCDQNGKWGILTGFSESIRIENNECSRSADEHGIYVSNSADFPVVRGNRLWGNNANGLHMNGDIYTGDGDGIITGALVENNVIYDNGAAGGSGINCDGVQNSRIQNNLLYDNRAGGITLYRIDGGGPSINNVVVNNTVVQGPSGRWALNIRDASTGNVALNNIFYNAHSFRGSINCTIDSLPGFVSNFNAVMDRFSTDDGDTRMTMHQWRAATGQDTNSIIAVPAELFADVASDNYQLKLDSPAIDRGTATQAPPSDLAGNKRPSGNGIDIGAYERAGVTIGTPEDDTLYLRASADWTVLEVYTTDPAASSPALRWPMSSASPLRIDTLGGNDQVIVQLSAGATGPVGGVIYTAGEGVNTLLIVSGSIEIESSATGTLHTTVEAGATLVTSVLVQDTLTIRKNGRVMIKPGVSVANLLTRLTIEPAPAQAAVNDHAHVTTTDIHPARLFDVRSPKTIAIEDRRQSKRAARGQFARPT